MDPETPETPATWSTPATNDAPLSQITYSRGDVAGPVHSTEMNLPRTYAERLTGIPTDDPLAALEFCRVLAKTIADWENADSSSKAVQPDGATAEPETAPAWPEVSIVVPIQNEQENLPMLVERLSLALSDAGADYEIVFVDDGSSDRSKEFLQGLAAEDSRVVVIELARNFGHQIAISAGLDFARGSGVIVMDGDLQDPPEVLPDLIEKWHEGFDVVYGIRTGRKEGWLMRTAYASFYRLLHRTANIEIPLDAGDFCIMDRKVVDVLKAMPERNRFVRGIRSWVGFHQIGIPYERQARYAGQSKYSIGTLMLLAINGLVSFSHIPLRVASLLGIAISLLSFFLAAFYFSKRILLGLSPPGFATLVVAIFFLAGIQLITVGVIGEYIGRIYDEVKRRPLYIVKSVMIGGNQGNQM